MTENNTKSVRDKLWHTVLREFRLLQAKFKITEEIEQAGYYDYDTAKLLLVREKYAVLVYELVMDLIENDIHKKAQSLFWVKFKSCKNKIDVCTTLKNNTTNLYSYISKFYPVMDKLEELRYMATVTGKQYDSEALKLMKCRDKLNLILDAALFKEVPVNYYKIMEDFHYLNFKTWFTVTHDEYSNSQSGVSCETCMEKSTGYCKCQDIFLSHNSIKKMLIDMNMYDKMTGMAISKVIRSIIEQQVAETCKGNFYRPHIIENLQTWFDTTVVGWIKHINKPITADDAELSGEALDWVLSEFILHLYNCHTRLLTSNFFTVIVDYPDSLPAIEDMRLSLTKSKLYHVFIQEVREAVITRLLHSGVNTPDILTAYISAFKCFRIIDPSNYLLDVITTPIKQYLQQREDTIYCIVSSLIDDGTNEFSDELWSRVGREEESESQIISQMDISQIEESSQKHQNDMVTVFISMFGSKQVFIDEYRKLLADRMLTRFNPNTDRELRFNELLKIRFGETDMLKCDVMVQDVLSSERIASHIKDDDNSADTPFNSFISTAIVMSAQFWPPFKDVTLQLPPEMQTHFDYYTKGFEKYKSNRTISWKPHLGIVSLDVILKNRTLSVTVTPIHAVIIYHFQSQKEWSLDDLSKTTMVTPSMLRKKMSFWMSQGVLSETRQDYFSLMEDEPDNYTISTCQPKLSLSLMYEEDDVEPAVATPQEIKEEELQVFWSYVVGMLTNLNSLTLDRIYQMLSLFVAQGVAQEITPNQLKAFLDKKVKANKLMYYGGFYRLPK